MAKYRKKPVVIEAHQINSLDYDDARHIMVWCNGYYPAFLPDDDDVMFAIETLEGPMYVRNGDWVIKGVAGEFYPCKDSIFQITYERVED